MLRPFSVCARQGADLGGERPLQARSGELLAGRQGCPPRGGIWRKPQAKRWIDEQEAHEAGTLGETAHIVKAPNWYGKRGRRCDGHKRERDAHYPGRSADLRSM